MMAILLNEPEADACVEVIEKESDILISSGTLTETLIVTGRRDLAAEARMLLDGLGFDVLPVTAASARRIADLYARWGEGVHHAGLNFGDCFAYELAKDRVCPLFFVSENFLRTKIIDARSTRIAG